MPPACSDRWLTRWRCPAAAITVCLAALLWAPAAPAQVTSWLYLGGGAGVVDTGERERLSTFQLDTGMGTSAKRPLVVGGLFRAQGYLGAGADLAIVARLVTRGFALGGFGVGLDAGAYQRWWEGGSTGFNGNLVLGAPWGITLLAGASVGTNDHQVYFTSLGIDLARLTVHRHYGLDWFANPMRSPGE